jgi:tetratricopeptide (TPR) repeat protein
VFKLDVMTSLSEPILDVWRRTIDRFGLRHHQPVFEELSVDAHYLRARAIARAGNLAMSARQFADVAAGAPTFTPALEAHGAALDMMGQSELAKSKYDAVRRLRSQVRRGAPDRPFALRNRGPFTDVIAAYTTVMRSVKQRTLPPIARGNAFLAEGRADLALLDYSLALRLRPNLHEVTALKAEALAMLGRYRAALGAFNTAIAARPKDAEMYSGRAIVHLALGRLDAADADWRRQLELLPLERSSARACVLLRLADYEAALPELERALEKEPADPYWRLYRLTALHRTGRTTGRPCPDVPATDVWPGPLLALHAGQLSADDALKRADNQGRRAEALFQIGVIADPHDREEARCRWQEVVDKAPPAMIEHAAARHELARLGS